MSTPRGELPERIAAATARMRRAQSAFRAAYRRDRHGDHRDLVRAMKRSEKEVDELLKDYFSKQLTIEDLDRPGPPEALGFIQQARERLTPRRRQ